MPGRRIELAFTRLVRSKNPPRWHEVSPAAEADIRAAVEEPCLCRELALQLDLPAPSPPIRVFEEALAALERGHFEAIPRQFRASALGPPSPTVSLQELQPDTESVRATVRIVLELVGEDEQPVPGVAYRLVGPDGRTRTGRLDAEGRAELHDLGVEGDCRVCFPELDEDAWEPVSAQRL